MWLSFCLNGMQCQNFITCTENCNMKVSAEALKPTYRLFEWTKIQVIDLSVEVYYPFSKVVGGIQSGVVPG